MRAGSGGISPSRERHGLRYEPTRVGNRCARLCKRASWAKLPYRMCPRSFWIIDSKLLAFLHSITLVFDVSFPRKEFVSACRASDRQLTYTAGDWLRVHVFSVPNCVVRALIALFRTHPVYITHCPLPHSSCLHLCFAPGEAEARTCFLAAQTGTCGFGFRSVSAAAGAVEGELHQSNAREAQLKSMGPVRAAVCCCTACCVVADRALRLQCSHADKRAGGGRRLAVSPRGADAHRRQVWCALAGSIRAMIACMCVCAMSFKVCEWT